VAATSFACLGVPKQGGVIVFLQEPVAFKSPAGKAIRAVTRIGRRGDVLSGFSTFNPTASTARKAISHQ
jgi:hypothetical protein